jgi:tRNA-2-methylthio-N6-dimethylallyladenosine synthase
MPDLAISTDMIVGFPGETAQDFDETMTLVEQVRYTSMFSFKYSERPNTLASKRSPDDVDDAEKTRRIVALQQLQREIQLQLHGAMVGSTVDVLIDAASRRHASDVSGRTSGNTVVNLPGESDWIGRTVPVTIRRAGPNSLWGERQGRT